MDSLKKIILIKSAKFDFSEVSLDGNNLFIGANGAGKTTLLRAILYFYTADSRSLGINNSKKISFSDYYFEYDNSYLVYIYKKGDKYILVTVYKDNSIKFRLCLLSTLPDIKDIYIDKNKPISHSKLWIKLKNIGLLSNILNSSEYKKTLYSKNKQMSQYSLFEAKEYDGFVKTLSNIFINNKVDSQAIKKVIVSSLNVEKKIDIEQIKRYLEQFNATYEDINIFLKNQKTVIKLISNLDNFEQTKNDLQDNFSILVNLKDIVKDKIKQLKIKNISLEKDLKIYNEKKQKENNLYQKRQKILNEDIGVLKQKRKITQKKQEFYLKENIQDKISQYDTLSFVKDELSIVLSQRDFLTKEHQELELSYQNQIDTIKNSFSSNKNKLQEQNSKIEFSKEKDILQLNTKLQSDITIINKDFINKENGLKDKLTQIKLNKQDLEHQSKDKKNEKFIFSNQAKLDNLLKEKITVKQNIQNLKQAIEKNDNKLESFKQTNLQELENIKQQEIYELEKINTKIQKIKSLITPNKNSLLSKIYDNNLNSNKYIYFINSDILNSRFNVDIKSFSNQIFELDILDTNIPQTKLDEKLQNILKEKDIKTREFQNLIEQKQKEFKNFENKIYREKRKLNEEIKELDISLVTLNTKITNLQNQQQIQQDEFESIKNSKITQLNKKIIQLNNQIDEINQNLQTLQKEQNNTISTIKSNTTKQINQITKEYEKNKTQIEQQINNLDIELNKQLSQQEQNYQELLKTKGIDVKKIQNLTTQERQLNEKIKLIESYSEIINRYNYDKVEYFDRYKETQTNLKEKEIRLDNLNQQFTKDIDIIKQDINKLSKQIENNNKIINKNEDQIIRVDDFENSSTMRKAINIGIIYNKDLNHTIYEDNNFNINTILDNITNLMIRYGEFETNIDKLISRLNMIFDNSLNIKKEQNSIITAYKIKEFYNDKKIEHYKELQSNNLNQIIKSCIQEYDHLITYSGKIESLVNKITKLFKQISIGVIDELSLRYSQSNNKIIEILSHIKDLNEQNPFGYVQNLFNNNSNSDEMVKILKKLRDTIEFDAIKSIDLEDSFVLEFRVIENGNDSKYQISLDMIGSNGTDVLVKTMIYIAMLHIFKTKSTKKDIPINVILDEIGILSQRYLKELIEFANRYSIYFINGAPDEKLIGTYKRVSLVQNIHNTSIVQELISYEAK